MRILHICLSPFTEGLLYQDNLLPEQNYKDGHDVVIIAECYMYKDGEKIKVSAGESLLANGCRLIRVPYQWCICEQATIRLKIIRNLYKLICKINPDLIFHHGLSGFSLFAVKKYKEEHPIVKIFLDSHADYNNSAKNYFSKVFQYRLLGNYYVKKILPYVTKIFYVSEESKRFITSLYKIDDNILYFLPLGGKIVEREEKKINKELVRKKVGIREGEILFVHSGKITPEKRTNELIKAFSQVKDNRFTLLIIGSISEDMKQIFNPLISSDPRILFLGWKNGSELLEYICAADMYLQPGSQSATMQNAICCGAPVMLYPYKSHEPYLKNNGYYVETIKDMVNCFEDIAKNPEKLNAMSDASYRIAHELLDYKKLAQQMYE